MSLKPKGFHMFAGRAVDSGNGHPTSCGSISIIRNSLASSAFDIVQVIFVEFSIISLLFSQSFIQKLSQMHLKEFPSSHRLLREEIFIIFLGNVVKLLFEMSKSDSVELQQVNASNSLEMLSKLLLLMSNFVRREKNEVCSISWFREEILFSETMSQSV